MVKLARKQLIKKKKLHTAETVKQHKIQKVAELAQLPRMDKIHQKAERCFEWDKAENGVISSKQEANFLQCNYVKNRFIQWQASAKMLCARESLKEPNLVANERRSLFLCYEAENRVN